MSSANLSEQLQQAAHWCESRGEKLTDTRRDVLTLLLGHEGSLKAYEILSALQKTKPNAAPPTVYRALDFLVGVGLVHRLDSLNAFVACPVFAEPHHACHPHASHPHGLLLVCERCHGVTELPPPDWIAQLQADAVGVGFQVTAHELEIKGLCRACREKEVV